MFPGDPMLDEQDGVPVTVIYPQEEAVLHEFALNYVYIQVCKRACSYGILVMAY